MSNLGPSGQPDSEVSVGPLRDVVLHTRLMSALGPEDEAFRQEIRSAITGWGVWAKSWEAAGHLPREVFANLGGLGFFRRRWELGAHAGIGRAVVLAEELALIDSGLGLAGTLHSEVFTGTLTRLARSEWQRDLLESALDGTAIGCFAVTETSGGSNIAGVATQADRTSDGWHLTGHKRYVSNGGRATHALVLARSSSHDALCTFAVQLDQPGVRVTGFYEKLGTNSCDAAHLEFDVDLAPDALLGRPGLGLVSVMRALELERVSVSAQLYVAAVVSLRFALAYARRRTQFGSSLVDLQALRHRMATCQAQLWELEAFLSRVTALALLGRSVHELTAALKLRSAEVAQSVVDESLQILGGRGYTKNYPLERALRDIRLARIGAGTDEIMRELLGAQFRRKDDPFDEWVLSLESADLPSREGEGIS